MLITTLRRDEVTVFAPNMEPIHCWRLNRSDFQLRKHYQQYILEKMRYLIPLKDIQVSGSKIAA